MTPDFRILANERDITDTLRDRLLSLRMNDEAGFKTDDVELVLDDRDQALAVPVTGAELDLALGYRESGLVRMGIRAKAGPCPQPADRACGSYSCAGDRLRPMNMDRLEHLRPIPRQLTPELETICPKPFFFLFWMHKKWEQDVRHAPLVIASVVQANGALYDAETAEMAPAVLLYSTDPERATDAAWLTELSNRLRGMREDPSTDPTGGKLAARLLAEGEDFFEDLPASVTGGVPARWIVTFLSPSDLPGGCIPADGLLPALATSNGTSVQLVPPQLYT